ncbi:MAG: hypothetical protein IPL20_03310 [Saprospiraceae bacterium]|nr:hypothetical protein [Saprospiraceae bacterium]
MLAGCRILYTKGATPRQIFNIVNHAITKYGRDYTEADILKCCVSFRANGDPNSGAFSSLSAINLTAFDDYFPWVDDVNGYAYPWYLEGIVDKKTGSIIETELRKMIDVLSKKSRF